MSASVATGGTVLPVHEPAASRKNHLEALTGVRLLAALAVYFSHIGAPRDSPEWLTTLFAPGYMGVTVFFVLSGFVLTLNYFDRLAKPTPRKLWDFGVARFARLYPLYLLVLVYGIVNIRTTGGDLGPWWEAIVGVQAWGRNWLLIDPPAWSVSVELFLYACFPLLVLALSRVRRTQTLLIIGGVVIAVMVGLALWMRLDGRDLLPLADMGSSHRWLYRTPLTRLGDFLLGILAARIYLNVRGSGTVERAGSIVAPLALLVMLVTMSIPALLVTSWSWDVIYAVPAVVLLLGLALAPRGLLSRLLARPTIVLLGEASYAFYLIHFYLVNDIDALRWTKQPLTPMLLAFELLTLLFILALSVGLHLLVEMPARTWIRRIAGARPPGRVRAT